MASMRRNSPVRTQRVSKIHGGESSEVCPKQEHPKDFSMATYRNICGVSTTETIPLETLSNISPNFVKSRKTRYKGFFASLYAPAFTNNFHH
ncbi:hypothetical protein AWC38_SpisGene25791 [Stylophora pistillata]|uniref:Uncharacterized protein n=1 Tax=Stylophora pistillata TaxID=50429 RepID=A0A2B4SEB9_STYPI|nr:hypothetical protein AWC38_SpisGene25791 [Stylophora pistillata]